MDDKSHQDEGHESLSDLKAKMQASRAHTDAPAVIRPPPGKPLIDQVSNRWRDEKSGAYDDTPDEDIRELRCFDVDDEHSCLNVTRDLCASRRVRRMIAYAVILAVAAFYIWSRYLQPSLEEEWDYKEGFVSQENGTYGIARGGDIDKDMTRIRALDHDLLPGGPADPDGKRRLVFVGDIHGCKKELVKLLRKVDFNQDNDHLVLVGDIISKGPDNVGVLDELIRLKATSVRGNHEDRVLTAAKRMHKSDLETPFAATSSKGREKDAAIVRQLKPHHLKFLRDMPLILHIPALPMALASSKKHAPIQEHIFVVHAGLVPGVRLEKQDPYFVMNMRSINRRTHVPSAERTFRPWIDLWGWYNDRIYNGRSLAGFKVEHLAAELTGVDEPASGWVAEVWKGVFGDFRNVRPKPEVVVYGHDSKAGLQIRRWSKGLDSGCVGGGELTAMILDAKGRQKFHSVGCKNYRD